MTRSADTAVGSYLPGIDGARGIAVLCVVVHHAFLRTRVEPNSFLPHWVNCGARGVDLFFVISGFCLAWPILGCRKPCVRSVRAYFEFVAKRISRIVPPYYAALALFVGLSFTGFGIPQHAVVDPRSPAVIAEIGREAAFLTSMAPLHNVSFWTLGFEMRWYIVCPLLILLFLRSIPVFFAAGVALYALYLGTHFGIADEGTLPSFMLGILAAHLTATRSPFVAGARFVAPVLLGVAIWFQSHSSSVDHGEPLWHLACFLILLAIVGTPAATLFRCAPLRLAGTAAYSIYLVNWPFTVWLETLGAGPAVAAVGTVTIGIAFWRWVERPLTQPRARARLEALLLRGFSRATGAGRGSAQSACRTLGKATTTNN